MGPCSTPGQRQHRDPMGGAPACMQAQRQPSQSGRQRQMAPFPLSGKGQKRHLPLSTTLAQLPLRLRMRRAPLHGVPVLSVTGCADGTHRLSARLRACTLWSPAKFRFPRNAKGAGAQAGLRQPLQRAAHTQLARLPSIPPPLSGSISSTDPNNLLMVAVSLSVHARMRRRGAASCLRCPRQASGSPPAGPQRRAQHSIRCVGAGRSTHAASDMQGTAHTQRPVCRRSAQHT